MPPGTSGPAKPPPSPPAQIQSSLSASWALYVAVAVCLMALAIAIKYRKTLATKCSKQERADDSIYEQQPKPANGVENPTAQ